MDANKVIDKIKKCLALGKSSNANEASIALRQAQKLMEQHGLSETDIERSAYGNEAVECPIQAGKTVPIHLNKFINLIVKAFQVEAVIESNVRVSDTSYRIRYFGPTHRITTAAYAHVVIYRAMERAWKEYLYHNPNVKSKRGARLSFMVGWLAEVSSKVEAIGWPEKEKAHTEMVKKDFYGNKLIEQKNRRASIYGGIADAGRAAAADFSISRPMGGERNRLTHN